MVPVDFIPLLIERTRTSWGGFSGALATGLAALGLVAPAPALHGSLAREARTLDASIEAEPAAADLHLARAEVYRQMRRWPEALADLNRAARLEPEAAEHHYLRALLFRDSGWESKARREADRFLVARPREARGYALRARLALAAGEPARAERDFDRAVRWADIAGADLYADRARAAVARGPNDPVHLERALEGLDAGVAALGELPVLTRAAIELEARLERWDAALERLDRSAAGAARHEWWRADRGELLLRAGRRQAAAESFHAARTAIARLSPKRRRTRSVQELTLRLDARLLELEGSSR